MVQMTSIPKKEQLHQRGFVVNGARWVVGVDENQGFDGTFTQVLVQAVDAGHPVVVHLAHVMANVGARHAHAGGPQRVVGRRNQHAVGGHQKRPANMLNKLGGAVAQKDGIDGGKCKSLGIEVVFELIADAHDALVVGVAAAAAFVQRVLQVLAHPIRGFKTERTDIADVEFVDFFASGFHFGHALGGQATDGVRDTIQF